MSSHFGSLKIQFDQCILYARIQTPPLPQEDENLSILLSCLQPHQFAALKTTWYTEDAHKMNVLSTAVTTEDIEDT